MKNLKEEVIITIWIAAIIGVLSASFPLRWYAEGHYWDKAYRYCMQMGDIEFGHTENERCLDYLKIGLTTEEMEKAHQAELELLKQRALNSHFDIE